MLDRLGRDHPSLASLGRLGTIVGRDAEVEVVIETLCRSQERNPPLVGPAGTGKTAIVEGLAQQIVHGTVPEILGGARIVQLSPSVVVAGAGIVGELETRMKAILAEAAAAGSAVSAAPFRWPIVAPTAPRVGAFGASTSAGRARSRARMIATSTSGSKRTTVPRPLPVRPLSGYPVGGPRRPGLRVRR